MLTLLDCQMVAVSRALTDAERTALAHLIVIGVDNLDSRDRGRYDILMSRLESAMIRGQVQYQSQGTGDAHLQEDFDL